DQSHGVQQLRNILVKHFFTAQINVMHADDFSYYLESLSEKGVYTATPIHIHVGKRKWYPVALSVR
ncbi:hypothetical protein ACV334_34595, partial [Pseudomonas aeruginosa]